MFVLHQIHGCSCHCPSVKDDPATPTVEEVSVKVDSKGVPPYATGHLRNGFCTQTKGRFVIWVEFQECNHGIGDIRKWFIFSEWIYK